MASPQARSLIPQEKKPRFALKVARFFVGEDYDEEARPAEIINFLYISVSVFALAALATAGWLISLLF